MTGPIVLYSGPSQLDGRPIVALATIASVNQKTGPLVQTWILAADRDPVAAVRRGRDSSVCGTCPRRHATGGDCYVVPFMGPLAAWRAWDAAGRPAANWTEPRAILALQQTARYHGIRIGSYGDPAAVPADVWRDLADATAPRAVVGYTHRWRDAAASDSWYRNHLMASADSAADAADAHSYGWRFFMAHDAADLEAADLDLPTFQCPSTREREPLTCATCGACDGRRSIGDLRASPWIHTHGSRARRPAALRTI